MSAGLVAAEADRITWITDVDPSGASVNIDRGQIEQVMINIVQNAVEAAGPDGTVAVRLRICERRPIVAVDDDGPGIAPEAVQNLFTPFFSTKPHGKGIGLTLVQEILSAHGCEYRLERADARWTRFTIVFEEAR